MSKVSPYTRVFWTVLVFSLLGGLGLAAMLAYPTYSDTVTICEVNADAAKPYVVTPELDRLQVSRKQALQFEVGGVGSVWNVSYDEFAGDTQPRPRRVTKATRVANLYRSVCNQ